MPVLYTGPSKKKFRLSSTFLLANPLGFLKCSQNVRSRKQLISRLHLQMARVFHFGLKLFDFFSFSRQNVIKTLLWDCHLAWHVPYGSVNSKPLIHPLHPRYWKEIWHFFHKEANAPPWGSWSTQKIPTVQGEQSKCLIHGIKWKKKKCFS